MAGVPPELASELVTRSGGRSPGVCVNVIVVVTAVAPHTELPVEKASETSRTVVSASSAASTVAALASCAMEAVVLPLHARAVSWPRAAGPFLPPGRRAHRKDSLNEPEQVAAHSHERAFTSSTCPCGGAR